MIWRRFAGPCYLDVCGPVLEGVVAPEPYKQLHRAFLDCALVTQATKAVQMTFTITLN